MRTNPDRFNSNKGGKLQTCISIRRKVHFRGWGVDVDTALGVVPVFMVNRPCLLRLAADEHVVLLDLVDPGLLANLVLPFDEAHQALDLRHLISLPQPRQLQIVQDAFLYPSLNLLKSVSVVLEVVNKVGLELRASKSGEGIRSVQTVEHGAVRPTERGAASLIHEHS
jgi:hypothetical protein